MGAAGGRYLEPSSSRAARGPGDSRMKGPLPEPPAPWEPTSDPHPVLLTLPQPDHLPPGLAFTQAVADCSAEGARGLRPYQALLPGTGLGAWELVLSQRGRKGHPLVPRDWAGAAMSGPAFLTKC